MHRFRERHEIRVREIDEGRATILLLFLPLDETILAVMEDHDDEVHPEAHRRLQLLRVHHEAAIARRHQHTTLRINQLRRDGTRHADAHACETVRDDAGFRLITAIEASDPHLMRADIGDQDVLRIRKCLPDIRYDPLRLHRKGIRVHGLLDGLLEALLDRERPGRLLLRLQQLSEACERGIDFTVYLYLALVVLTDIRLPVRDMHDTVIPLRVPFRRLQLHQIIADADDEIRLLEQPVDIIPLWDTDGHHGVAIVRRNDALRHHGVHDRNMQLLRKRRNHLRGSIVDGIVPDENQRLPRRADRRRRHLDLRLLSLLLADHILHQRHLEPAHLHLRDIYREVNVGGPHAAGSTLCVLEGETDDFIDRIRTHDQLRPLRDRLEDLREVEILMARQMHLVRADLTGDRHKRRTIEIRIRDTRHEIRRARTQRREAHACLTGETAIHICHERRTLLMPHHDEVEPRLIRDRLDQLQILLPRDAEDVLHPLRHQTLHHQFRRCTHNTLLHFTPIFHFTALLFLKARPSARTSDARA